MLSLTTRPLELNLLLLRSRFTLKSWTTVLGSPLSNHIWLDCTSGMPKKYIAKSRTGHLLCYSHLAPSGPVEQFLRHATLRFFSSSVSKWGIHPTDLFLCKMFMDYHSNGSVWKTTLYIFFPVCNCNRSSALWSSDVFFSRLSVLSTCTPYAIKQNTCHIYTLVSIVPKFESSENVKPISDWLWFHFFQAQIVTLCHNSYGYHMKL